MTIEKTGNLSACELVSDSDFESYLESIFDKLPAPIKNLSISSMSDTSGNVNRVKRIELNSITGFSTTLIVKHVPLDGKLARFPSIRFSSTRLDFENRWFTVARAALKNSKSIIKLPEIYLYDKAARVLIMEDLGKISLSDMIASGMDVSHKQYNALGNSLRLIHDHSRSETEKTENLAASQNRPFLFETHLKDPQSIIEIWSDNHNSDKMSLGGKINLQTNFLNEFKEAVEPILASLASQFDTTKISVFAHGDLHTRSIIISRNNRDDTGFQFGIIDSELSDYASPDFDLGFLLAHLMAELYITKQSEKEIADITVAFLNGYGDNLNLTNIMKFTGAEILRRLLGPAGFYQDPNKQQFEYLLELSKNMLLNPTVVLDKMKSTKLFEATDGKI